MASIGSSKGINRKLKYHEPFFRFPDKPGVTIQEHEISRTVIEMKYLFLFNDSPHGNQRSYNGLRLAVALAKSDGASMRVFLLGDGILCGLAKLNPAHADYNPQEMLRQVNSCGVQIGVCGTCMDARGISDQLLIAEAKRSSMDELRLWVDDCDKVLTF